MSLEKTSIGSREPARIRGQVGPDREALRIPGPPPVPTPKPPVFRGPSDTSPGLGQKRVDPPSLLRTHVGLGAVSVDPDGAVKTAAPLSPERRFLVRAGERKGELVLTVLPAGVVPPSTVMSVRLGIDREDEARALALLVE